MSLGMDYQGASSFGGPGMAGGFGGNTGSPPPSSNSNRQRKSYGEQTFIPVTVTMLHQARSEGDDNGLVLADGRPLHHVKFVGAVRSVDDMSTASIYQIEDGTGLIDVKQWSDGTVDCSAKEHVYVSIVGQLKEFDSKKTIVADSMRQVTDANELTHHMLEVVYEGEKAKKQSGFISNGPPVPMQGIGFGGGSFPNRQRAPIQSSGGESNGFSEELTQLIREEGAKSDAGVTIAELVNWMRHRHSEAEIRAEIQNLTSNGILYSTVNEESFKVA